MDALHLASVVVAKEETSDPQQNGHQVGKVGQQFADERVCLKFANGVRATSLQPGDCFRCG
jgi:hypothetical protein